MSGKESFEVEEGNQAAPPSPPLFLPPPTPPPPEGSGSEAQRRFARWPPLPNCAVFWFVGFFPAEQRTFRYCSGGCDSGQRPLPLTAFSPAPVPPHPPLLSHLRDGAGGVARGPV